MDMANLMRILRTAGLLALVMAGANADEIAIINARIVTMDDDNPDANTLLISENRIVSVDSSDGDRRDWGYGHSRYYRSAPALE